MEAEKKFDQASFQANDLIYRNFATKMQDHFIGVSIQKQYLYIVETKIIYVYEYTISKNNQCLNVTPLLTEQIHLPFQISEFVITPKYICIRSNQKTQIRDRFNWEKLIFIMQTDKNYNQKESNSSIQNTNQLFFQIQEDSYITWNVDNVQKFGQQIQNFYSTKTNILTKQTCKIMLGQLKPDKLKTSNKTLPKPPIYLNQVGKMSNFYIWAKSQNQIDLGMLFDATQTRKSTFQISTIHIPAELQIKQLHHYRVKRDNQNEVLSENLIVICQNKGDKENQNIQVLIYQILPPAKLSKQGIVKGQKNSLQALEDLLGQMQYLQNSKDLSQQKFPDQSKNSLINQILQQVMESQNCNNGQSVLLQRFKLTKGSKFIKSFYNSSWNRLWIYSPNNLAQIVFNQNFNLIRQNNGSQKEQRKSEVIKKVQYFKMGNKTVDAVYQNIPVVIQKAFSFQMVFKRGQIFNNIGMNEVCQDLQLNDSDLNQISQQKHRDELNSIEHQKIIDRAMSQYLQSEQFKKILESINSKTQLMTKQVQTQTQQFEQDKKIVKLDQKNEIQTQTETKKCNLLKVKNVISYTSSEEQDKQKDNVLMKKDLQQNKQQTHNDKVEESSIQKFDLKSLNFENIQELLTRFSTLFVSSVTKQTNKLKQSNKLAKQQIKIKIKEIIKSSMNDVIQPLLSNIFIEKLQKQAHNCYDHTTRVFNQQFSHFNQKITQNQVKQNQIKKGIMNIQMQKIDMIRQASMQVINVSKVRQMQKIAYNQLILQNIKDLSAEVKSLQQKLNDSIRIQFEAQNKIVKEIQQLKTAINQIIEEEEKDQFDDILSDDSQSSADNSSKSEDDQSQLSSDSQQADLMENKTQVNPTHPYIHNNKATSLVNSQSPSNSFFQYYNPYPNYSGQSIYNVPPPPMLNYNAVNQMNVPYNGYNNQFGSYMPPPPSISSSFTHYPVQNSYHQNPIYYPHSNSNPLQMSEMASKEDKPKIRQKKKKSHKIDK